MSFCFRVGLLVGLSEELEGEKTIEKKQCLAVAKKINMWDLSEMV